MAIREMIWYFFICAVFVPQNIGAKNNRCIKNELYEHSTDCRKFYSCTPFGPVLMHCPAGLHFDPQNLVCEWPEIAGCKRKMFEESDPCPIYPDPNDCAKFYLCAPSGPTLMQCPGDLLFNPQLLVCDWFQNVECVNSSLSSTEYPASISTLKTSKITEPITDTIHHDDTIMPTEYTTIISTPEALHFTGTFTNEETTEITASTQNYYTGTSTSLCKSNIWPHPNDCRKFFLCGSTGVVEMFCPEEMHFNPELLICDWNYTAGCDANSNLTPEITTTNNSELSTTQATTTGFTEIITTEYISTTQTDAEHLETTSLEDVYTTPTGNILSTGGGTESIATEYYTKICDGSIWPNPKDCTKFFMCGSTGAVEKLCPEYMHFNPTLLVCDWPINAGCRVHLNETTEFITDISSTIPSTTMFLENIMTEHHSKLTTGVEYLETTTMEDATTEKTTDILSTDGYTEQNPIKDDTDMTQNFESTTVDIITDSTTILQSMNHTKICNGSIWPNTNDCTKFFMCGSTGTVEKLCPEYMHFNPILLVCDWPVNAGCKEHLNVTPEIITTEFTMDISTTIPSTTMFLENIMTEHHSEFTTGSEYLETTTMEDTTTEKTTTDILSTDGYTEIAESTTIFQSMNNTQLCEASIWPNPEDCTKFFMCGSTGAVEKLCPENMHFNPILLICDWPLNAGCGVHLNMTPEIATTEFTTDSSNTVVSTTLSLENITTSEENLTSITTTNLDSSTISEFTTTFQNTDNTEICKGSIWAHSDDCAKFFTCDATGAVENSCPEKLHFNPVLLVCDYPYKAGCKDPLNMSSDASTEYATDFSSTTNSASTDATTGITNDLFETVSTTIKEDTSTIDNPLISTTDLHTEKLDHVILNADGIPSNQSHDSAELCKASIWPHPDDCKKFFMCGTTGPVELLCNENLHFNPVLLVCDWPDNARCKSKSELEKLKNKRN